MQTINKLISADDQKMKIGNSSQIGLETIGMQSRPIKNPVFSHARCDGNFKAWIGCQDDIHEMFQVLKKLEVESKQIHYKYLDTRRCSEFTMKDGVILKDGKAIPVKCFFFL